MQNSILLFSIMFGFWVLLSGKLDAFHLSLGVVSSILVVLFTRKTVIANPTDRGGVALEFIRIAKYGVWLVYQIILSGIDVANIALRRDMKLKPGIIKCDLELKSEVSRTVLANSITLTPGTMTVDISGDVIYIHCLSIDDEQKLIDSENDFENQIKHMLGYKEQAKIQ